MVSISGFCQSSTSIYAVPISVGPFNYIEKRPYSNAVTFFNLTSSATPATEFNYTYSLQPSGGALPSWLTVTNVSLSITGSNSQVGTYTVRIVSTPKTCGMPQTNDFVVNIL